MSKPPSTTLQPSGISLGGFNRIDEPPAQGKVFADDILVIEVLVRRITVHADLLLSYVPLEAGALSHKSKVKHMLVPYGSVVPAQIKAEVHWLPPLRETSPVAKNTYMENGGVTLWHLLALRVLPDDMVIKFIEAAGEASEAELKRDLWEYTGKHPLITFYGLDYDERKEPFASCICRLPESDKERIFRYRTPLEVSLIAGKPIFSGYGNTIGQSIKTLPAPIQEMRRWSESLIPSRRLSGRNGLG